MHLNWPIADRSRYGLQGHVIGIHEKDNRPGSPPYFAKGSDPAELFRAPKHRGTVVDLPYVQAGGLGVCP
jgi:hypothetical protein